MAITSLKFFAFLAVIYLLYCLVPRQKRWFVLLGASLFFYVVCGSLRLFVVTLLQILVAYGAAIRTDKQQREGVSTKINTAGILTCLAVLFQIGALLYYKEMNFFVTNGNILLHLLGKESTLSLWQIVAPLGISYYTLSYIAYILDVYWGVVSPQRNFLKFCLFGIYFPIMISGPITRYQEIEQDLYAGNRADYQGFCFGLQRILWGLFKKLVIADRMTPIVQEIWSGDFYGWCVLIGVLGYAWQLYMDFSGCMDVVLGASELFGIRLPENFNTPLYATSLSEYWRRWHITLGAWVKDYVMYPILKTKGLQTRAKKWKKKYGKKMGKKMTTWIGLFFTWLVVGLWHGGAWTFVFGSGLFFFLMIVGGQILEPIGKWCIEKMHIPTQSFGWKLWQRIRTFVLFSASISFSWSASMKDGFRMWARCFKPTNLSSLLPLASRADWFLLVIGAVIVWLISYGKQKEDVRMYVAKKALPVRWILYLVLLFAVLICGVYGPGYDASSFIYGQF